MVSLADVRTSPLRSAKGVSLQMVDDGTPVTTADVAAKQAMLAAIRRVHPTVQGLDAIQLDIRSGEFSA